MAVLPPLSEQEEPVEVKRPRRPGREKFRDARRGLKLGIRGHSSFFVHFFAAAVVIAAAVALQCTFMQWALLIPAIGFVLTT
jgi:diacylglycerol kinase